MERIKTQSKFADQSGEIMIVELGGHVDQSNSFQLQKMFEDIIASGCYQVVVDFKDLFYMSSAGWGVFIGEIKRFRENGGDIKLANMNPDIQDVFQMLEFYHILEDYVSVDEAVSTFKKSDELDLVVEERTDPQRREESVVNVESQEHDEVKIVMEDTDESVEKDENTEPVKSSTEILSFISDDRNQAANNSGQLPNTLTPLASSTELKLHQLPLTEKIKHIIAQNPLMSVRGIRKVLRHEHFGYTRVSTFRLIKLLRDLDLNSKAKRYRFYRSC